MPVSGSCDLSVIMQWRLRVERLWVSLLLLRCKPKILHLDKSSVFWQEIVIKNLPEPGLVPGEAVLPGTGWIANKSGEPWPSTSGSGLICLGYILIGSNGLNLLNVVYFRKSQAVMANCVDLVSRSFGQQILKSRTVMCRSSWLSNVVWRELEGHQ